VNTEFCGRDFGKVDIEGYQIRVPRGQIAINPPWSREELLLKPDCWCPLSSSGFLWPSALSAEEEQELTDPAVGLILPDTLPLALAAVAEKSCEVLFQRLIGFNSTPRGDSNKGDINTSVPPGFGFCGFEVTNGWWGQSPLNAEGHNPYDWREPRSIAGEHVNEWNLLDDFAVAHKLAMFYNTSNPIHGPYRVVLFATATAQDRRVSRM
jgi:hypothetical protein